ncbi:hypothetical protein VPH35_092724 [Triticum aestivum]
MANAPPSSGGLAVDPPVKVKKKAPRKPRLECTPEEIAKLDAESAKRRERRAVVKVNAAAAKFAAQREELEAARRKAAADEKEDLVNKAHAILMLGMGRPAGFPTAAIDPASIGSSVARPTHCQSPMSRTAPMSPCFPPPRHDGQTRFSGSPDVFAPSTPHPAAVIDLNVTRGSSSGERPSVEMLRKQAPVDDPFYNRYMEDVIFDGGHGRAYDPDETQSQDGRAEYVPDEGGHDRADYDHGDSCHEDDDIYVKVMMKKKKAMTLILVVRHCSSTSSPKERHNDKPFTLTHCWTLINMCPKFKDQYRELQRKRGLKTAKFAGGGDGEALKRPRGKTNSKVNDIRDASSMALHETLHGMMSQKDVRDEKKRQSKDEQMKQYLDLQRQKLEMEEAAKRRKIDMEEAGRQRQLDMEEAARQRQLDMEEAARQRQLDIEADNVKARQRHLDIEATNAASKAKEVALAIMSVDLSKMSDKTRA